MRLPSASINRLVFHRQPTETGERSLMPIETTMALSRAATQSAVAARCAAEQGKYWEFRHTMIINASQLQPDKIVGYAQNASMDVDKFKTCIASDKYRAAIDKDVAEGTAAGVSGTPSFVLGRVENGKLEVKKRIPKEELAKNMPLRHNLSQMPV